MYAIYGSIYHQYTPNVSIFDPMGREKDEESTFGDRIHFQLKPLGHVFCRFHMGTLPPKASHSHFWGRQVVALYIYI